LNRNIDNAEILPDNKILIVTGGFTDEKFLASLVLKERYSLIIAADKGLVVLDRLKILPDMILGDFDSAGTDIINKYRSKSVPVMTYPSQKDKTDTELAFEWALEQNPSVIDLAGATGSRLDHTMANINLLLAALRKNVDAKILDPGNKIYLKAGNFVIKKDRQHGDFVSLLPFTYQVKGLKLRGFKYPLDGLTLTAGSSLGISNEIVEEEGRVEFDEGILLVFETKD